MTKEKKDELRRLLYNGKFTTDSDDKNPFVGMYFDDLLTIIKDYVEQPLIEKACEWLKENIYHRVYECGDRLGFPTADFIKDFRKAMCNG